MHAEMHAIFNATDGWSPAFSKQVSAKNKGSKKDSIAPSSSSTVNLTTGQSQSTQPPPNNPSSSTTSTSAASFKPTREKPQCLSAGPRPQYLQEQQQELSIFSSSNQTQQPPSYGSFQLQLPSLQLL